MSKTAYQINLSSRGQTVIPKSLRQQIGDSFTIIYDEHLKKWTIVNIDNLVDQMAGIIDTGQTAQAWKDQIRNEESLKSKIKSNSK